MNFKCKWCGKDHPAKSKYKGYDEYYEGMIHQHETGEILLYTGYNWIKKENSHLPKGNFKLVRRPSIKDAAIYAGKGDYFWNHGHGISGRWQAIEEKTLISPFSNTVYAIKI